MMRALFTFQRIPVVRSPKRLFIGALVSSILCVGLFMAFQSLIGCGKVTSLIEHHTRSNWHWLLMTLDTLRQDHVGAYGNPRVKTPMIDLVTRKGLLFTDAVTESPWTIPSHASLMTSRWPREHGALWKRRHLDNEHLTAAEILAAADFTCAAFVSARPTSSERGFNQGFHFFEDKKVQPVRFANEIIDKTLTWLQNWQGDRLFLWTHYFDPHHPYNPPEPYCRMYPPEEENNFDLYFKGNRTMLKSHRQDLAEQARRDGVTYTPDVVERALSLYDGETTFLDGQLEKLFRFLDKKGILRNSVITMVADHGEFFGEDELYFMHAHNVAEPVIGIPWILRVPTMPGGRIIDQMVQHTDTLPTVLDLLSVPTDGLKFSGRDLVPLIMEGTEPERTYGISEFHPGPNNNFYSIRAGRWKYVLHRMAGREITSLYDLHGAGETNNLIETFPAISNRLRVQLDAWLTETEKYSPRSRFEETKDMQEALQALGYVDN